MGVIGFSPDNQPESDTHESTSSSPGLTTVCRKSPEPSPVVQADSNSDTPQDLESASLNCTRPGSSKLSSSNSGTPPVVSATDPKGKAISLEMVTTFLKSNVFPTLSNPLMSPLVRPKICQMPLKDVKDFCISLSGCGFLGSYHFGAVSCFVKNGQPVLSRLKRVSGASAGSLVASLLLLAPEKLDLGLNILYEMADELNSLKFGALTPGYFLNEKLIKIVDSHLPENITPAHEKLMISMTNQKTRQNELVCCFESRSHLIQCLLASCYIPMYSMGYAALPPVINGTPYIDGGYTNNLPDFDDVRTITVSPFSGSADISPSDHTALFDWQMTLGNQQMKVNLQNIVRGAQALFPPSREVLKDYYQRGYKDTFRYLLENELLQRAVGTAV